MSIPPLVTTLPLTQRSLALTASPSFREFLQANPILAAAFRSRRREIRLPLADQEFFVSYPYTLHFVLLLADESPETLVVAPVLAAIATSSPRFTLQIVRESDDLASLDRLVEEFDLIGAINELDLPLLLVFDEEWTYQGHWGPHPQEAERYLDEWFERHPDYEILAETETSEAQAGYTSLLDQLTHEMRVWYNSSLNAACVREVRGLLVSLLDDEAADEEEQD
ncbi:MAG: hypothetical protein DCC55_27540 [Chloroflexi bacterium]|nr:MAG: hypothetical protein DCC55_27540 [Chloroflexota bacterium]